MTRAQKVGYAMKCDVVLMLRVCSSKSQSSSVLTQMRSADGFPRVTILRLLPSWFPGWSTVCCLLSYLAPWCCPSVIEPGFFGHFRRNLGGRRVVSCRATQCWLLGRARGHSSLLGWKRILRLSWYLLLAYLKGVTRMQKTLLDPMDG
jgi:hypothetical protein